MVDTKVMKIGWIGTGVMGKHMAMHLMTKGSHQISVYNRTEAKAEDLVKGGATYKTPKEIAQEADYLFLMLGYPHDVEEMLLNKDTGILQHMKKGACVVDHTTSTPSLAVKIAEEAANPGFFLTRDQRSHSDDQLVGPVLRGYEV